MDSFVPVPLPSEIPFPPDLSQLPTEVLHAGTVEMLIQQNEDLVSRLRVNLRRTARYEQEIFSLKSNLQELENIKAQNEIFKEKDVIWQNKKKDLEETIDSLKSEISHLNLKYSELYDSTQTQISELEHQKQLIEKNLSATTHELSVKATAHKSELEKIFRDSSSSLNSKITEVTEKYENLISQNNKKIEVLKAIIKKAKYRFKVYNEDYKQVKKSSIKSQDDVQLLRTKIEDLCLHIQRQENDGRKIQAQLVESYEERINSFESALKNAKTQILENGDVITDLQNKLESLNKKHSQATNDKINLENRSINFQREQESKVMKLQEEINILQQELSKQKALSKSLAIELESKNDTINKSEAHIYDLKKDTHGLEEQLDALRIAWSDTQKKFEQEKLKSESLVKINQNLSQQLKNQRKMPANMIMQNPNNLSPQTQPQAKRDIDNRLSDLYRNTYKNINK